MKSSRKTSNVVNLASGTSTAHSTTSPTCKTEYREDGYIYKNNNPVCKWHIYHKNIRMWEPRMNNAEDLYIMWKKHKSAYVMHWAEARSIIDKIWATRGKSKVAIAHAIPDADSCQGRHLKYSVDNNYPEVGLSFRSELDVVSNKMINHRLGQRLYEVERRNEDLGRRFHKVEVIFFDSLKKCLPPASEFKIMALQFRNDTFYFKTNTLDSIRWKWEMLDTRYSLDSTTIM